VVCWYLNDTPRHGRQRVRVGTMLSSWWEKKSWAKPDGTPARAACRGGFGDCVTHKQSLSAEEPPRVGDTELGRRRGRDWRER
jgi:hypothetical protein